MRQIFPLLVLLAFQEVSFARIGETQEQVEARYGKSVMLVSNKPRERIFTYSSKGLNILVVYFDGKSSMETYKAEKGSSALSDVVIQALLEVNSGGMTWAKVDSTSWKTEDRVAYTSGRIASRDLTVVTVAYSAWSNEKSDTEEKKRVSGF